jgi:hypothetical protein
MLPAKEKKASFKKMHQIGFSAKQARTKGPATAMDRERAKEKEKGKPAEIGIGKERGMQGSHLVLTIAKEMAIASGRQLSFLPRWA